MFYSKLALVISLILASTYHADAKQKRLNHSISSTSHNKRTLQNMDTPLMTTIVPLDKDYKDLEGAVTVDYDSRNQLVLDFDIKDGPERCDDCVLAIFNGKSCSDLGKAIDDDGRYSTNNKGGAAGMSRVDRAFDKIDLECQFVVLFGDTDNSRNDVCEKEYDDYKDCRDEKRDDFDDCRDDKEDELKRIVDKKLKDLKDCKDEKSDDCAKKLKEYKDVGKKYKDVKDKCDKQKKEDERKCDKLKDEFEECEERKIMHQSSYSRGDIVGCGQLIPAGRPQSYCQ